MTTENTHTPDTMEARFRRSLDTFIREAARGVSPSVTRDTLAWYVHTLEAQRADLLAALERCEETVLDAERHGFDTEHKARIGYALIEARQAIAKARGEAQLGGKS